MDHGKEEEIKDDREEELRAGFLLYGSTVLFGKLMKSVCRRISEYIPTRTEIFFYSDIKSGFLWYEISHFIQYIERKIINFFS